MKGKKKMKNKSTKILILALVIATMLCAAFAVMTSANETETKPEIISKNMLYSDRYSIMYAVSAETVVEAPVTLNVYREYPTDKSTAVGSYVATAPQNEQIGGETRSVYVFTGFGIGAQDFADKIYAQAIDKAGNKSEVVEYSVVEYFLERLYGGYDITPVQKNLYEAGLIFGAAAQDRYAADDAIRVNDYKYVRVEGGTVNGVTKGMFTKETELTLALGTLPEGNKFKAWNVTVDGVTTQVTEAETTITVSGNTLIEVEASVPGPLGYFAKYGGYDFTGYTKVWDNLEKKTIIKRTTDVITANQTDHTNTANGGYLNLRTIDDNTVLAIGVTPKGYLSAVPGFNCYIPEGTGDCYVFEADVLMSPNGNITEHYSGLSISFCNSTGEAYASKSIALSTVKDGTKIYNLLGSEYAGSTWFNLGVKYYAAEGLVEYYIDGELVSTDTVEATTDTMARVKIEISRYKDQYVYFDNMFFGVVDETSK